LVFFIPCLFQIPGIGLDPRGPESPVSEIRSGLIYITLVIMAIHGYSVLFYWGRKSLLE
jgi:hypothetical protein